MAFYSGGGGILRWWSSSSSIEDRNGFGEHDSTDDWDVVPVVQESTDVAQELFVEHVSIIKIDSSKISMI